MLVFIDVADVDVLLLLMMKLLVSLLEHVLNVCVCVCLRMAVIDM